MSGELMFTFAYGGALIVMGVIVHLFLNKMERSKRVTHSEETETKKEVS